jgi:carbon storage regulator
MLVLTRKTGETVHIGAAITLTVLEVNGHRIRIGIDAPREVPIWRDELWRDELCRVPADAVSTHLEDAAHADGHS